MLWWWDGCVCLAILKNIYIYSREGKWVRTQVISSNHDPILEFCCDNWRPRNCWWLSNCLGPIRIQIWRIIRTIDVVSGLRNNFSTLSLSRLQSIHVPTRPQTCGRWFMVLVREGKGGCWVCRLWEKLLKASGKHDTFGNGLLRFRATDGAAMCLIALLSLKLLVSHYWRWGWAPCSRAERLSLLHFPFFFCPGYSLGRCWLRIINIHTYTSLRSKSKYS